MMEILLIFLISFFLDIRGSLIFCISFDINCFFFVGLYRIYFNIRLNNINFDVIWRLFFVRSCDNCILFRIEYCLDFVNFLKLWSINRVDVRCKGFNE